MDISTWASLRVSCGVLCFAVAAVAACAAGIPLELKPDALPQMDAAQFVGAIRCATCHASQFDGWKGTLHSRMVQRPVADVMSGAHLQCSNCHDSHSGRHTSMTLKSASDNALCLTCHAPGQRQHLKEKTLTEHTHHASTSTGSRCIECHMAKTGENTVAAEARNHTFDFISPGASIKTGTPNSCNLCHKDRSPEWSVGFVREWYPQLSAALPAE